MNLNSKTRSIHILKTGLFYDIFNRPFSFSEDDLDRMAAVYNARQKEGYNAPLCLGHPANDIPQYGQTNALISRNGNLYAIVTPNSDLISLVRANRYKKVSAAFHHPTHPQNPAKGAFMLKHIGFLGSMPPAIKSLESFQFSEHFDLPTFFAEDSGHADFSEYVNLSESDHRNIMHHIAQDISSSIGVSYLEGVKLYHEITGD
ncbi:hypothetical protein ACVWBY_03505 [Escherichia coli]|uniref:hypothetical protein n=1 Tax=Escherichia coli TaxID=562 RepID=UPI001F57815E|nr:MULTISPECIES: hypothetical protein [Enterobacterales]MDE8641943.1 hypothetical protein [Proteus mirabilis]